MYELWCYEKAGGFEKEWGHNDRFIIKKSGSWISNEIKSPFE